MAHIPELKNLPLSSNQWRLWITYHQDKANPAYNLQLTYHLPLGIDYAILKQSLSLLFERHHTMFSVFKQKEGNPYINILPREVKLELVDFSDQPAKDRRNKILDFAGADSRKAFDIENGPLYRSYLLKEDENSYYFHTTVHHLIFDGWSRRLFVIELSQIYNSLHSGKEVKPEPVQSYSYDFAKIENESSDQKEGKELAKFWGEYLKDCPAELRLPLDRARPSFSSGLGRRQHFELSKNCSSGLKAIAVKEGVSQFNVSVAILGTLLSKYTGETEICIGVPVSTRRNFKSSENVFGLFVSTSVLRLSVDGKSTFGDFLRKSRESIKKSLANSKLPFDKIVEAVKPERRPGINPLFQVSLSYMTDMTVPMQFDNIACERVTVPDGVAPFDISFYMWEENETIKGDIEYDTDIFNPDTIDRLRESFIFLAESVAGDPVKIISDLSIVSEKDKLMLAGFNNTGITVPDSLIQDLFEETVLQYPGKVAVVQGNISLTYKELDSRANKLAGYLISLGAKNGDTIGICLERTPDMILAVMGVLKAGCSYLPMDPQFPDDRLNYMFVDSAAGILVTQSSLKEKTSAFSADKVVFVDEDADRINACSETRPPITATADYQAYIIYTSGSTGKPKGVPVRHRSVVNLVKSMTEKPGIKPDDKLLAVVTLSFDMSVYEIFLTLSNGATLVVADSKDVTDGMTISRLITNHDITVLQATPSFWHILLASGWEGKNDLKALCGGEALTPGLIKQMLPRVGEFWNCYGPTETTVYATCMQVTDQEAKIHIGKPINNTTAYILDNSDKVLPVGLTGELAIGGIGLAKGYRNRPELTEEKFIKADSGEILYKTGDVGRFLPDGNIELFGRADNQIKLRGFRIEPGEIETLLTRLPHVKEAVVKLHHFGDNDDRLIAFLNAGKEFTMGRKDIIATLSQDLPSYMIPFFFQVSPKFPRLPNGKINKKLLKYEATESEADRTIDIESLTKTQKSLYSIWGNVLKTLPGSLDAGFFDIGGNSILGIRLLNSISEEFGVKTDFREITEHSSFSMMSQLIDNKLGKGEEHLVLKHLQGTEDLPLTANQKRLWMISQMQPDIPSYIIRLTYSFSGSFDTEIFKKSIGQLFKRHYTLFSVIRELDGEPYFAITEHEPGISSEDFSGLSPDEIKIKTNKILNTDSVRPFDLYHGPLYRMYLIKNPDNRYLFHFTVHHIIFDGWSQGLFANDLSEIYNGLANNRPANLTELKFLQYDYAEAEKNREISNTSVSFWREYLQGCSPALNFPYDFQRSGKPTGKGSTEEIKLTQELSGKLRQLSKDRGVSLFTLLLGAYGLQLSKYSGESDLNIGLPVAHRPHSSLEHVFGMFVNTVVVRLKYDENDSFSQLIGKTNDSVLDAISHQDVTFDVILERLNPERVPNANPLFQMAFAWQDNLNVPLDLKGVKTEVIRIKDRPSVFDLTLYLWDNNGIIEGEIEYNRDLLLPETILRFKDHFINLLSILSKEDDSAASSVNLITEAEMKMIGEVNDTPKKFTDNKTIIQLFEEQADKTPENIALEFDGLCLTYSELNQKAEKLAASLLSNGIQSGDFVALLLKRSPDLVVTLLALFKIGAAYVPLNLTDPEHRVFSIMETAKLKYIIANKDNTLNIPDKYCRLNLEQLLAANDTLHFAKEKIRLSSTDSAYIIFTSGTTGVPKGVWVNHRAAVNLIEWVNQTFNISSSDRLLWATNLSFDLSVYDIFGILIAGGIVRMLNDDDRLNPEKQYEIILKEGITFWDSAPQALNQVSRYFTAPASDEHRRKLRLVFLSGDWIPLSLPPAIKSAFPGVEVVGLGGATEATVWSNFFIIGDINPSWKSIPYGKPIQNSRYYVLDEKLNHCWVQKPGDLYIGGDCLALGYYNDKALTDKKFIPDPYNPGERLYFTGDKAQWMPDGNIEFLGREDDQLKVRGYRVELGEIKNAVLLNRKIKDVAIVADKTDRHDIKIILFIILHENETLELKDLRKELRASLPEYMLPSDILKVGKFPMTSNGKLDSKSLLAVYSKSLLESRSSEEAAENAEEIMSTLSDTGKIIYQIWSETLKLTDIHPDDDFFDLGGNSLLAISLINKIREKTGTSLTFREILAHPTISLLSDLIDKNEGGGENIKLVHNNSLTGLPLTGNQKRLWMEWMMNPDSPSYIISYMFRLAGNLNMPAFTESLNILFNRHHIVFSTIKDNEGEPFCDIKPTDVNFSFSDYSLLGENEKRERVKEIMKSDSQTPFNLETGPLYRIYFLKTSEEEHYFLLSIHHIIFDGWSWSVFANDLSEIYNSLLDHNNIVLPDLDFQEYDYALWEKNYTGSDREKVSIDFWKNYLNGCSPVLNFPYDAPRKEDTSDNGGIEKIKLSKELSDKLRAVSAETGVSLFSTMLGAFGALINRYSGDDDINIGMPVAYRPHTKLERIFGMFVNTIVIRLKYDKNLTFREALKESDIAALNAISHQDLNFEKVVEIVKPERLANTNPLFQVAFAWQNNLKTTLNLSGVSSELITGDERAATFDITLALWENDDFIEGDIDYNKSILQRETILRLKEHFIVLLEKMTGALDQKVCKTCLASEREIEAIDRLNANATDYPKTKTISGIFQDYAGRQPDHQALSYKNISLTYKELNEKANQLGRTLKKYGVSANVPVGIFADKSPEMIIGILAVLKAGGCYAPIDPDYPRQRIDFILKDAGIKLILTQDKYMDVQFESVTKINLNAEKYFEKDSTDFEASAGPGTNAYIIYTSGTTGTPKGTPIPNRGVIRLVCNTNYHDITPRDKVQMSGAIVFDATSLEIWLALLNGATLHIIDKETLLNEDALRKEIELNKITCFITTSALFTHFVENRPDIFKNLRYVMIGGDVLSPAHANKFRKLYPDIRLINAYGPTENSCISTFLDVDRDYSLSIPIGKPNSNSTVYIFDRDMNYQPVGIPGELYVGGDGLSSGYLNRDDLNIKCFIEHPYRPGERIYKTGDLVRWLPDLNIDFLGRVDNQIKIRGFRVEIEEIESVLSEIEGVIEAVVKPVRVEQGDYRLVAFLNVRDSFARDTRAVTASLRSRLPVYMIPSDFRYMDAFPKTTNGKTDRKALKADFIEPVNSERLDPEQLSPTEKSIHQIWCDLLKMRIESTDESFFDIGGNSLVGLKLLNVIREQLGVTVTFKELVANPSINRFARLIDTKTGDADNKYELVHLDQMSHLPLTNNQKRLWLISRMQPGVPSYIVPNTHKLSGPLNVKVFEKSLGMLFERHFIVFSRIKSIDGEPYIDIAPHTVELPLIDLRSLPEDQRSTRIEEMLHSDSQKAFDLENGPLYRMFLVQTEDEAFYFHVSLHHIIFDGWSWSVFARDLENIYSSLLNDKIVDLPLLEIQEYDYANWEKKQEGTNREEQLKKFWAENLNGCSPVLNFPYDFQRKDNSENKGGQVNIGMTKELTSKIKLLAKTEGTSVFTTLLTAFGIELQKYSGEDDINIGLWVANRPHSKLENIFGLFVNTIVARLKYDKDNTFKEILRQTNETALNAITHQDLSFDKVVDLVNPERSANINPLFQIVFAWQDNLGTPLNLEGVSGKQIIGKERTIAFDIVLSLWENNEMIQGLLEYNIDLIKQSSVIRLMDNYIHLLESIAESPLTRLSQFSIVSDNDRKLLAEFNKTDVKVPDCLISDLFEEKALSYPDKIAVTQGLSSITYKDLDEKSNQFAWYLLSRGVTGGHTVGISLDRTPDMVTAVLGILKTGCSYLPMDPSFPEERLNFMYEDSGAKILVTESSLKDKYSNLSTDIILLDSEWEKIRRNSKRKPDINIDSQSLAYIIYTSGSTGKPKGVKVHHRAVVNFLKSMSEKPGITIDDRVLAVTTMSFDISVLEIFLPLTTGAEIVIAGYDEVMDGSKLIRLTDKHNISILQATPATWNLILAEGWKGKNNLKALCGGEAIPSTLVRELLPRVSSLWNMYGPTETTVWSTCYNITDADAPVLVGKPIYNTKIFIIDKDNRLLPAGVVGEVAIGGLGVTKGYHNRQELTDEKFIRFEDEGVVYKTGDQGRFLDDGNIELYGRIDNQIKLRGFRIEPGEIETLLAGIPEVREAVVKVQKFGAGDERLVAFLNAAPEFKKSNEEIMQLLSRNLPTYMVPSLYQVSDSFPRLPNGKINKKALAYEIRPEEEVSDEFNGTLTETEDILIQIWKDILKHRKIGLTQSFFNLGGNSLLAISLMNKIKEKTGVLLSFREIITFPTISMLAARIDQDATESEESVKMTHSAEMTRLPLTNNQKRIWLISMLNPELPLYNIRIPYKLKGSLNINIFRKSLKLLFDRHYIVYSQIKEEHYETYCDIVPGELNLKYQDYSDLPESCRLMDIMNVLNKDSKAAFDLLHGPLYRINLIKASENEFYFQICIHHIIFDGWSHGVLVKDLNDIYNSLLNGKEVPLEKLEYQQFDYAQWERGIDYLKEKKDSVDFWKENLKGCSSMLNFPYDFPRPEKPSGKGSSVSLSFTRALSEKIRQISENENASLFTTLLSVFGVQMSKYSGEEDLNIGLPVAFRPHSKLENIFGMFVNTVVVRLLFDKDMTFRKIVRNTNDAALNSIAHQDLPFENVVELVNPERFSSANPLFQVGFTWQTNLRKPFDLQGVTAEYIVTKALSPIFDITLYMWEKGDILEGELEYNSDLLKEETVVRLKDNYIHLLDVLVSNPDLKLSQVSIISEKEREKINALQGEKRPVTDCLIQSFFESQAKKQPEKQAVISGERQLSYRELDEKANQIANYLISLGVKGTDVVGVCLERSEEMIVSVLGILKAGCCYLPMDPSFPDDRIQYMFEDSGAGILISQSSLKDKFHKFSNARIILSDIDRDDISGAGSNKPDLKISSDSPAYIIYTSGSTGKPKGVPVHHKAVVNLIESMSVKPGVCCDDKVLAVVTLSFDMSVYELFVSLSNGATVVVAGSAEITDGARLIELIEKHDITEIQATPSFWNILLSAGWKGKKNLKALCGGEALTYSLIDQMLPRVGEFWNCYGPTETTVYSTCMQVTDPEAPILIGKPLNNTVIHIIDRYNNPLPVGITGEVAIGGTGVTGGYLNRPELTAEKFIKFEDGSIVYKTGDQGKLLDDGSIELFGRLDNQIKLRGFRIEPGEIETLLTKQPHIREAVVKLHNFGNNDQRLIAYIETDEQFNLTKENIIDTLSLHLPQYMIPSFLQEHKEFPRLPNGKINKRALELKEDTLKSKPGESEKRTPTEEIIYQIWKEEIKTENISIKDNFFYIGGNSLLAISVFSRIESAFQLNLTLRTFFDRPSIKDIAEYIDLSVHKAEQATAVKSENKSASKIINGEI